MGEADGDQIKTILANQGRMESERALYEPIYRDIDRYIDPFGNGGFLQTSGKRDVEDLYDITGLDGLDRFTAAIAGVTIPRNQIWHGLSFGDEELDKLQNVRLWCEFATKVLFSCRYAPSAGFEIQAHEDIRQEGKYGTAPLWIGEDPAAGIFFKSLHLSEVWIDENYYGRVDTVHRRYTNTLRQVIQEFKLENLSPKTQERVGRDGDKVLNAELTILHVVRPNAAYEPGRLGPAGLPIESVYIELDEKHIIRRKGFYSFPIPVSRHITGPRDKYGRSPAMKVLASVKGANAMARTILDAGNRAVNPPLLMYDDADITTLITKPGGATPGGLDEMGRPMVVPLVSGQQLPIGLELLNGERGVIKGSFLEEFFRLLSDPSDRMTATQVMETLQKEGVLIAPFAGRRETEKLGPMIERELDIHMRAGRIPPFPNEALEAKAKPRPHMTNPLARMARAEEVSGWTRWVEIGVQAAGAGAQDALDRVDFDAGMKNAADVLGVPASLVRSDDAIAELQQQRSERQAATDIAGVAPQVAGAAKDLATANATTENLANGGGL